MDAGPQRRLLHRRPAADVPAAEPGPRLRLPGHQRRVAAAQHQLDAAVDPPDDPGPQGAPDVRPGHLRRGRLAQPHGALVRPRVRRRRRPVREQPLALPAAGGAGPAPLRGLHPGRADRAGGVPADRRPALHAHPGRARLLLVRAVPAGRARARRTRGPRGRVTRRLAPGCRRRRRCRRGWRLRRRLERSGRNPMTVASDLLREWMPHQRWFGGKGREWADVAESGFFLERESPVLSVHRLRVTYVDGGQETYLIPVSWHDHPTDELQHAFIGAVTFEGRELYGYDAMRDRDATVPWLQHLVAGSTVGPMHFHAAGVAYIPEGLPGDIVSGEQSNTSLIYGDQAILKLFRRLEPGLNPDVEVHDALRRTQNEHIAPLLGYIEIDDPEHP